MPSVISIAGLTKTYASGFQALKTIDLEIAQGEIFALLGPNGAGKTTLISIACGLVQPERRAGRPIGGHDIQSETTARRAKVRSASCPRRLTTDAFESVFANTVSFTSRGLFGLKRANPAHIERVLRDLSLWDKRDSKVMTLSGGMKRRVLIAKALAHEPKLLFLDEPTAGVDVDLRRDMWAMLRPVTSRSVATTIILTTHYIDEAEEMADRVGVINAAARLILVEDKATLMTKLGRKQPRAGT